MEADDWHKEGLAEEDLKVSSRKKKRWEGDVTITSPVHFMEGKFQKLLKREKISMQVMNITMSLKDSLENQLNNLMCVSGKYQGN